MTPPSNYRIAGLIKDSDGIVRITKNYISSPDGYITLPIPESRFIKTGTIIRETAPKKPLLSEERKKTIKSFLHKIKEKLKE